MRSINFRLLQYANGSGVPFASSENGTGEQNPRTVVWMFHVIPYVVTSSCVLYVFGFLEEMYDTSVLLLFLWDILKLAVTYVTMLSCSHQGPYLG